MVNGTWRVNSYLYKRSFAQLEMWHQLGQGKNLDEELENMGMVVEGVRTSKAAYQLLQKYNVEMPITETHDDALYNGTNPGEALLSLMNSPTRQETVFDVKENKASNVIIIKFKKSVLRMKP